jgi:hypothetical protein
MRADSVGPWLLRTVFTVDGVTDFRWMFLVPIAISILSALLLAAGFLPSEKPAVKSVP